jgi:hypothetical protein
MKAPHPTPMFVMREVVADSTDLAMAMLEMQHEEAR